MDEIEVVNSAFALLKHRRITSLTDGSEQAIIANLRFAICRDAVLESNPWNFATYRATLAQSDITPANTWSYQFPLPTDPYCIKVRDFNPDSTVPAGWEIAVDPVDGRVLMTNQTSAKIRYTGRQTNLNVWSPLAVVALTYFLAGDLAIAVTGQKNKADEYRNLFKDAIQQAITSDAREGSPVVVSPPTTLSNIR